MFAARLKAVGRQQNSDNGHRLCSAASSNHFLVAVEPRQTTSRGFWVQGIFSADFFHRTTFLPRDVPYGDLVEEALPPKVSPHGKSHRTTFSSRHSFAVGSFAESSLAVRSSAIEILAARVFCCPTFSPQAVSPRGTFAKERLPT